MITLHFPIINCENIKRERVSNKFIRHHLLLLYPSIFVATCSNNMVMDSLLFFYPPSQNTIKPEKHLSTVNVVSIVPPPTQTHFPNFQNFFFENPPTCTTNRNHMNMFKEMDTRNSYIKKVA